MALDWDYSELGYLNEHISVEGFTFSNVKINAGRKKKNCPALTSPVVQKSPRWLLQSMQTDLFIAQACTQWRRDAGTLTEPSVWWSLDWRSAEVNRGSDYLTWPIFPIGQRQCCISLLSTTILFHVRHPAEHLIFLLEMGEECCSVIGKCMS